MLAPHNELDAAIASACHWLIERNIGLAQECGVGLESTFSFMQDDETLALHFDGGRVLRLTAQVIGTFDPRDRSFAWSWANRSIAPALSRGVSTFRDGLPQQLAIVTPVQCAAFDPLTRLLALAAHSIGADGVYRCVGNDGSLFLAIWVQKGPTPAQDAASADGSPGLLEEARVLVSAYDAEMLPMDQEYEARTEQDGDAGTDDLIGRKLDVYRRYWQRENEFWTPRSLEWPSEHDPAQQRFHFAAPAMDEGVICATVLHGGQRRALHVKRMNGQLKIVDQLIGWGGGFIWPLTLADAARP